MGANPKGGGWRLAQFSLKTAWDWRDLDREGTNGKLPYMDELAHSSDAH